MKVHWVYGLVGTISGCRAMDLFEASAKQCSCASDCPAVTCFAAACSSSGKCEYSALKPYTKCPGQSCSNGGACDDDENDYCGFYGECVSAHKSFWTVCRPAAGPCDVAEYCTGHASTCPLDSYASAWTTCSGFSNGGACDAQDYCDGYGNCVDKFLPSSQVCRAAKSSCDVSEYCTGTAGTCPADTVAPATTKCEGKSSGGACDSQDYCDGKGNCVDAFKPSTTVCRAAKSTCDVAETCTGKSSDCPADSFASSTTTCTGTCNSNPCDGQDLCDGKGNCVDVFLPSTTVCRPSTGQCDVAETCTGHSGYCPIDKLASSTTACVGKSSGGACDGADYCDGKGNCIDAYLPSTTVCRASKGDCDIAEYCTGNASSCPVDGFACSTTKCNGKSSGGACDSQDFCDGSGNCVDTYKPTSFVCRASKGQCDIAETCSGTSGVCPLDTFASTSTKCTGTCNGNPCDAQDLCDGKGNCVDVFLPSTTVCRAAKGQCDAAETCTGTSGFCPADAFATSKTTCTGTSNGNPCDGTDVCDGKGNCVDMFLSSTTVCRASKGQCDVAETCSGTSGQCPKDTFACSTTKCTGTCNGNPCDGVDYCDGKGSCIDNYLAAGTVCGNAAAGPCTIPATCTGDMGFCPPDTYADSSVPCTGKSQGGVCDGKDFCDGSGNCVDRFLNGVVCKKPVGYARPTYCNGKSGSCPASSYLEASPNLRDMSATETVSAVEGFVAVHASSPLVLVSLVCVVAAVAAFVTLRHRRAEDLKEEEEDHYKAYPLLLHQNPMSAAF
ncbi:hypothetical protein ACHHYP_17082 [Achlya hypogyna]|uniref:Disintegrin domain-containing protein n=1 Tax=Achlya hypogyna TaxID=1202772 RepID=A0A1V9Y598_ACHHY|nr:hypothetical protein ACHHYP_17082 [Achlya hypogyna]